jgi:hypothetical protein
MGSDAATSIEQVVDLCSVQVDAKVEVSRASSSRG